jgi:DNA polymerase (family X)
VLAAELGARLARAAGRAGFEPVVGDQVAPALMLALREVEAQFPPGVASLLSVPGIGPRRARALYQTLGIDSLDALRAALAAGRLGAAGIGPREAERIAAGLTALQATDERLPLATAQALGRDVMRLLTERVPAIRHIALAGSLRRMRETIGDLDIAAAAEDPAAVVAAFAALPAVARVELRGPTRCRVVLHNGVPADLWVLPARHWGSLLHHTTGNKALCRPARRGPRRPRRGYRPPPAWPGHSPRGPAHAPGGPAPRSARPRLRLRRRQSSPATLIAPASVSVCQGCRSAAGVL